MTFTSTQNSNCWAQILIKLKLNSDDEIQTVRKVLDFMGFKTIQSLAKLMKRAELDRFEIGVGKLFSNVRFREMYPELKGWTMDQGDVLVVKDIAAAAVSCLSYESASNVDAIQQTVFERCKKVSFKFRIVFHLKHNFSIFKYVN